jgi:C2 domain
MRNNTESTSNMLDMDAEILDASSSAPSKTQDGRLLDNVEHRVEESDPDPKNKAENVGHCAFGHETPVMARANLKAAKEKVLDKKQKVKDKTKPPGGFDDTPLPKVSTGYTVKFVFHKAANLPAADLTTASSDPFLHATVKTSLPKRHKEEPDLTHRTRTLRDTTEPDWQDEWIVANIPSTGFVLKCRLYDEDSYDKNDRLGNATIKVTHIDTFWNGYPPPGKEFKVKKRSGSKRAYFFKGISSAIIKGVTITPSLFVSIQVLGDSDPPHGQLYTVGPTTWIRHFSPVMGRLAGTKVRKNADDEVGSNGGEEDDRATKYE